MTKDYDASRKQVDANVSNLMKANPDVMRAFRTLAGEAGKDGALDARTKELMALATAIAVRCEGCIVHHVRQSIRHGADRQQVAETIGVAIEMGGGPSTVYGAEALAAFDQFAGQG